MFKKNITNLSHATCQKDEERALKSRDLYGYPRFIEKNFRTSTQDSQPEDSTDLKSAFHD